MMNDTEKENKLLLMKPFMPPMHDFLPYLVNIWKSQQLTNGGPVHAELEKALCNYLGVKQISLFSSGTLALVIALKSLKLKGEVITTPFTSVATIQAIYWNKLKPVFVDIDEMSLNLDAGKIDKAITPDTTAILPVHLFGNPCDVEQINIIARKYKLNIVYDAAHCFGIKLKGESLCNVGNLSVLSFHATKVFNTFEGGAIVCHDETTKKYIDALKNTGLTAPDKLAGYGLNAKMNEIQSAFGLVQLQYIDEVIGNRKAVTEKYRELLKGIRGIRLITEQEFVEYNYSYLPIIINPERFGAERDELYMHLKKANIFTRKYFSPLVCDYPEFSMFKTRDLPVAQKIANNILCLPLYHDISPGQIEMVVKSISQFQQGKTKSNR